MTVYTCHHHGTEEHTLYEISHHYCGCDGTAHLAHLACRRQPAPAGTPRPEGWPIFLSWTTPALPVPDEDHEEPFGPGDLVRELADWQHRCYRGLICDGN